MFQSRPTGLAKMLAGRRNFFRGPYVRHLWCTKQKIGSLLAPSEKAFNGVLRLVVVETARWQAALKSSL